MEMNIENITNHCENEICVEIPIKKKKGRKSKKKELELKLELETKKENLMINKFPKLSEKIFDVLVINGIEYFYDTEFNILLDSNVIPVGFKLKHNNKFVFYSEITENSNMIKNDDYEVNNLINKINYYSKIKIIK